MSFVLIACSDNNEQNKIDASFEGSHTEDKQNNADKNSDDSEKRIRCDSKFRRS